MSTRKTASVARHPKPAKPAAPSAAKLEKQITDLQSEVRHLETTATKKHKAAPAKKHKAAPAAKHKAAAKHGGTKRGLALGDGVACCAAEALAATLRLAGQRVTDDDVLELYYRTAAGPDDGATIAATLAAAAEHGLAGIRPTWKELCGTAHRGATARELGHPGRLPGGDHPDDPLGRSGFLILGVVLPGGPHAITFDPRAGGAWSWGELFPLAQLTRGLPDEAWQVSWT